MNNPAKKKRAAIPLALEVVLFVGAVVIMVGCMYYSITYPYPNGESLDLADFVMLWLREIIIVAIIVICLLLAIAGWLAGLIRRLISLGNQKLR